MRWLAGFGIAVAVLAVGFGGQDPISGCSLKIVGAWRTTNNVYVRVDAPSRSASCRPAALAVGAWSVADQSNRTLVPKGAQLSPADGLSIRYRPGVQTVTLLAPVLQLPPYVAFAAAVDSYGNHTPPVTRAIPERGDYCLRHSAADQCMSEAQALALRCEQATVPKTKCVAWIYGTQRFTPTPVGGATHAQVQQSLRATLLRQLTRDVHLVGLACTERLVCTASFTWDQGGSYRVRYTLNGIANKPGCWYTTEVDDLTPRTPGQTYVTPGSLPATRQGSCI